jgi:hypothetical protein
MLLSLFAAAACGVPGGAARVQKSSAGTEVSAEWYRLTLPTDWTLLKAETGEVQAARSFNGRVIGRAVLMVGLASMEDRDYLLGEARVRKLLVENSEIPAEQVRCEAVGSERRCRLEAVTKKSLVYAEALAGCVPGLCFTLMSMVRADAGGDPKAQVKGIIEGLWVKGRVRA